MDILHVMIITQTHIYVINIFLDGYIKGMLVKPNLNSTLCIYVRSPQSTLQC